MILNRKTLVKTTDEGDRGVEEIKVEKGPLVLGQRRIKSKDRPCEDIDTGWVGLPEINKMFKEFNFPLDIWDTLSKCIFTQYEESK